jgi:hypothetical protein
VSRGNSGKGPALRKFCQGSVEAAATSREACLEEESITPWRRGKVARSINHSENSPMSVGLEVYTLVHVMLSVFGIAAGFVVVGGFIAGLRLSRWIDFFVATTLLTNLTGFGFPFARCSRRTSWEPSARSRCWARSAPRTGSTMKAPGIAGS